MAEFSCLFFFFFLFFSGFLFRGFSLVFLGFFSFFPFEPMYQSSIPMCGHGVSSPPLPSAHCGRGRFSVVVEEVEEVCASERLPGEISELID